MAYPVPLLMFNDPRGLELPEFNTIRLGGAWADRIRKRHRVLLATKFAVVASVRVAYIHVGKLDETLERYASLNHIELALRAGDPAYNVGLAALRRLESMVANYGPNRVHEGSKVTVIGLRR